MKAASLVEFYPLSIIILPPLILGPSPFLYLKLNHEPCMKRITNQALDQVLTRM